MIRRASRIALAATFSAISAVAFAVPAQADQVDLFENPGFSGGYDYRTTPDTMFSNNTFNNGHALDNAISSVVNFGSTARLCTGNSYTGSCFNPPPNGGGNLNATFNDQFSSITF
ncbi:hypothetical protein [Plantactinospora sp. KLBMP9567]|uniref:hypothetical protein n=1 Tax=Plantactinospora sp. KLBMP9567 TaxID=3085900 RepID=UPI0029822CAC|nr:hypothetical protein [Plantactinospora sp. KLBMP9567]MDW5327200.1 hypothetical protein [Plantactinospora sp. KLBMP9567]